MNLEQPLSEQLGEGYTYVWLNTNTKEFSKPFTKKEVEQDLNIYQLEQAEKDGWALIEYKAINGVQFEF